MRPHQRCPTDSGEGTSHDGGEAASRKKAKIEKESQKPYNGDDHDIDYDSDSSFEDYYLFCDQEREFMAFMSPSLHAACNADLLSWENPLPMINILKRIITTQEKWENLPSHAKYLNDMIVFMQKTGLQKNSISRPSSSSTSWFDNLLSSFPEENKGLVEYVWTEKTRMKIKGVCSSLSETLMSPQVPPDDNLPTGDQPLPDNIPAASEPNVEPTLIIQRRLKKSDMCNHQQRLSMPCNQVERLSFLTAQEEAEMDNGVKIPIRVIDPGSRIYRAQLRKTRSGERTYSYAIGKPWNEIKRANRFSEGMEIKVTAVREAENEDIVILLEKMEE